MDIADVKKKLSSDEKILESAFKLETIYKKYKFVIWGVVGAVVISFAGSRIMDAMHQATLEDANSALLTLQQNPQDTGALATLKSKNPVLFELFSYAEAIKAKKSSQLELLAGSSNEVIADLSRYSAALLKEKSVDSVLYKEMALVEGAYLALKAGNTQEAKEKLSMVDSRSSLANVVSLLNHATIKVQK